MNRKKQKIDYQKLTEEIAQEGGLQTGLGLLSDPIARSKSEGLFLRQLHQKRHPFIKLFVSIVFFLFPLIAGTVDPLMHPTDNSLLLLLSGMPFILLYGIIGFFLFASAIRDFQSMKK